jgi:hypothetical protein
LSQAVLDHADFAQARLAGANLCGANLAKARNLTEAQLAEALGDASTLLPPHLRAPESWTATAAEYVPQPVVVEETRAVTPIAPPTHKSTAGRVSWLVGGPLQTA